MPSPRSTERARLLTDDESGCKENTPPPTSASPVGVPAGGRPGLLSLWRRRGRRQVSTGVSPHITASPVVIAEDEDEEESAGASVWMPEGGERKKKKKVLAEGEGAGYTADEVAAAQAANVPPPRFTPVAGGATLEDELEALSEAARRLGMASTSSPTGGCGIAMPRASPPTLTSSPRRPPRPPSRPSIGSGWCTSPDFPLGTSSLSSSSLSSRTPCNTPEPDDIRWICSSPGCSPDEEVIQRQLQEELDEQWRSPRRGQGFNKAGGLRKHVLQLRASHFSSERRQSGQHVPMSPPADTRISWAC